MILHDAMQLLCNKHFVTTFVTLTLVQFTWINVIVYGTLTQRFLQFSKRFPGIF